MTTTNRKTRKATKQKRPIGTIDDWFGVKQRLELGAQGQPQARGQATARNEHALPWRKSGKAAVPAVDPTKAPSSPLPPGLYAKKVSEALEESQKNLVAVECYRDEGLLWVQVCYDKVVSPSQVLPAGEAIQRVLPKGCEVLFQTLRPQSIYFIIGRGAQTRQVEFLARQMEFDAQLPAEDYGVSLNDLKQAHWR